MDLACCMGWTVVVSAVNMEVRANRISSNGSFQTYVSKSIIGSKVNERNTPCLPFEFPTKTVLWSCIYCALMGRLRAMICHALVFGLLHQMGAQSVQNVTEQLTDLDLWCMVPCWQEWRDELSSLVPFKLGSITDIHNACVAYFFSILMQYIWYDWSLSLIGLAKKNRGPCHLFCPNKFQMTRDDRGWAV